jgi:hypothetical protein
MTIDRNAQPHSVTNLLKAVDAGDLGLPEFQRDFIWKPGDIIKLLQTIARQWPCGTFLLQEGSQELASKPLDGAPRLKQQPKLLVLDGQQRLTALYHAIRGQGHETYFVKMADLETAQTLDDDHIRHQKTAKYRAMYPTLKAEAASNIVRVSTLTKDTDFFKWASYLSEAKRTTAIGLRDEQLSGFKHYSIPCVVLEESLPLNAVARIFETLNRTGVKLDTFDLMVAKLYPFEFRLRDEWLAAQRRFSTLRTFKVDGVDILKAIALREHLRQIDTGTSPLTVKGVRESDVISLDAMSVKAGWESAVVAYHRALRFLRDECGVATAALMPAKTMALPLSAVFDRTPKPRDSTRRHLRRWFWSSCALQTYAQGANTQCVRDARELLAWRRNHKQAPESVSSFQRLDVETLSDSRRRNEILLRALVCSIVLRQGSDWIGGKSLASRSTVPHRIVSRRDLKVADVENDVVVDYTGQFERAGRVAASESWTEIVNALSSEHRKQHLIPAGTFRPADIQSFREKRASLAAEWLTHLALTGQP